MSGAGRWKSVLDDLAERAPRFRSIPLEEIGRADLLRRADTKYLVSGRALPDLLQQAEPHYRALEVEGTRLARYETVYYDTPELALYHAHYGRVFPRAKVRVRTYLDTGQRYLETKVRQSAGWSRKERWPVEEPPSHLLMDMVSLPPLGEGSRPVLLVPVATVTYHRLTLVARGAVERVTLDVELALERDRESATYPAAVVVEVKQPVPGPSRFAEALSSLGARPRGISKYCLAVAALGNGARTDRFEPLVNGFQQLGTHHDEPAQG